MVELESVGEETVRGGDIETGREILTAGDGAGSGLRSGVPIHGQADVRSQGLEAHRLVITAEIALIGGHQGTVHRHHQSAHGAVASHGVQEGLRLISGHAAGEVRDEGGAGQVLTAPAVVQEHLEVGAVGCRTKVKTRHT